MLRRRLRELAQARPRFGYLQLHVSLRREGWRIDHKRVHRLYREEVLAMRFTRRRKCASHLHVVPPSPSRIHERWSMDFVADTLLDGLFEHSGVESATVLSVIVQRCAKQTPSFSADC
ncbi:MAG TPA: IS3 family transposase [Nitrospira sp.]|nr:IS3 family transposase [Nitrospira sp.]